MPPKLRHECERCGLVAELERAGRYRDADYLELFHEYMALEQDLKIEMMCRATLAERVAQLAIERDALKAQVLETATPSECPF